MDIDGSEELAIMLDSPGYTAALTADLSRWRERIALLNNEIAVRGKERDELTKKVSAAETLLGVGVDADGEATSLRAVIKDLMADGAIRKPKEIRRDLVARGYDADKVSSSTGNFYNSLGRLVEDGALNKDDASRYWDPTKSGGPTSPEDIFK
jgi:hypothetical protein